MLGQAFGVRRESRSPRTRNILKNIMMTPPPPPPPPTASMDHHPTGRSYKNGPAQRGVTQRLVVDEVRSEMTRRRTEKSTEEAGDSTTLIVYNPILSPILQCGPV